MVVEFRPLIGILCVSSMIGERTYSGKLVCVIVASKVSDWEGAS